MSADVLLLSYAGLAAFASAQRRHGRQAPRRLPLAPSAERAIGVLLLAVSLVAVFAHHDRYQAVVVWIGLLSLSGLVLVLLLSRWRGPAMALALVAPILALTLQLR